MREMAMVELINPRRRNRHWQVDRKKASMKVPAALAYYPGVVAGVLGSIIQPLKSRLGDIMSGY
jgi:hypothetical protein